MKELIRYLINLGWYSGTFKFDFRVEGTFEGWHGRASETWEYRFIAFTEGIKESDGKWIVPPIDMISERYENVDAFATRVLDKIKSK